MKNRIFYVVSIIFLMILPLFVVRVTPTVKEGYQMYENAMAEKSIIQKISEIRADDNYIKIDNISDEYINQLIKVEDRRFYFHAGMDPIAIVRAMYNNFKANDFVQGGSTITQQLAKNLYFSFEKSYERKVAELFVAFDLERLLTKDEILELYCNVVYFGEGCYGIKEAAKHYYNVKPIDISLYQASKLVFTLRAPEIYNPHVYKLKAA